MSCRTMHEVLPTYTKGKQTGWKCNLCGETTKPPKKFTERNYKKFGLVSKAPKAKESSYDTDR